MHFKTKCCFPSLFTKKTSKYSNNNFSNKHIESAIKPNLRSKP